ncbi:MAG: hypothetical protein ACETWR_22035 [Anaerolineae bacterium]
MGAVVVVAAIAGTADAFNLDKDVASAAAGVRVNVGPPAPVHPAGMMTTRSQQRKVSL